VSIAKNQKIYFGTREVIIIKPRPFDLVKVAYKDNPELPFYVDEKFLTNSPQKESSISLALLGENDAIFEVVCSSSYLDVGLAVEVNDDGTPRKVMARSEKYSTSGFYGGVNSISWIHTGQYLTEKAWKKITHCKGTDEILSELGIKKVNK
jgi:hypothetical protein